MLGSGRVSTTADANNCGPKINKVLNTRSNEYAHKRMVGWFSKQMYVTFYASLARLLNTQN